MVGEVAVMFYLQHITQILVFHVSLERFEMQFLLFCILAWFYDNDFCITD